MCNVPGSKNSFDYYVLYENLSGENVPLIVGIRHYLPVGDLIGVDMDFLGLRTLNTVCTGR